MKKKLLLLPLLAICSCLFAIGLSACDNEHTHEWSKTFTEDGDRHYQTCAGCDELNYSDHTYTNGICVCGKNDPAIGTEGLEYRLNDDSKSYSATGLGTATDKNIVIASKYQGLPVTSIGELAFGYCTPLTSVTIPDGITSIGNWAFNDCTSLTSVTIGNSVTSIGYEAFLGCTSLTRVYWDAVNCKNAGDGFHPIFSNCSKLTTVTIGDKVEIIPGYTFKNCTSLTSVTIGKSVTSIGHQSFFGCISLTNIVISERVKTIGNSVFEGCTSLTVNCEAEEKPSGWKTDWNISDCPVVWGYKGEN